MILIFEEQCIAVCLVFDAVPDTWLGSLHGSLPKPFFFEDLAEWPGHHVITLSPLHKWLPTMCGFSCTIQQVSSILIICA